MRKKHTPWRAEPLNRHKDRILDYEVFNSNDESLFFVTRHEHVNVILQAVNNHDRLVEALEWAVRIFEIDSDTDWLPSKDRFTLQEATKLLTELKS